MQNDPEIEFEMTITETRMNTIKIIATSSEIAIAKATKAYNSNEFNLDSKDCIMHPVTIKIDRAWPLKFINGIFVDRSPSTQQ